MGRKPRSSLSCGVYHVLNRGLNRMKVFERDGDKTRFFELLKEYSGRFEVRMLHWVVMSNHYHLVLDVDNPKSLTKFVWGLQRKYTGQHHRVRREVGQDACGHLWQGRFKSILAETDNSLLPLGRYVERNPARAGMVELPWDYQWSSARAYTLGVRDGLTDCEMNGSYMGLGRNEDERQRAWRDYLIAPNATSDEPKFKSGKMIGSEDSQARIHLEDGRPVYGRRGKARIVAT